MRMRKMGSLILAFVLLSSLCACASNPDTYTATLYFLDGTGNKLVTETREIEKAASTAIQADAVLTALVKGPAEPDLKSALPADADFDRVYLKGSLAVVEFNKAFEFDLEVDALCAGVAVTNTLCEIEGIERVRILVDGRPMETADGIEIGELGRRDIISDSQLQATDSKFITLYFASPDGEYLVPEGRTVQVNTKETLEYVMVKELIAGPDNGETQRTVPAGTQVISVETREGVCFVNLSAEFKDKHTGGSAAELMTIYSVVNTLTELDAVDKVQFLIEGQKVDEFIHVIFNEPFERNERLIQ